MRFMMMLKGNEDYEAGTPPSPELGAAIAKYSEEQAKGGVLLASAGLAPGGARLHLSGGTVHVTDGPFAEAKELIAGYAIIQADSMEEAIEHGKRFLQLHADVLGDGYELESDVRQLLGPVDFEPDEPADQLAQINEGLARQ